MAITELDPAIWQRASAWLKAPYDQETREQVQAMVDRGQATELTDAFYKDLEFGTGGLRGIMGAGTNRMNKYTIGRATQGLSNYLKKVYPNEKIKVAISYDSRNNSPEFARVVASVFSGNGFTVYLFDELRPTPQLSFAVRHLGCHSGVMLTASHNPKEYSGYKAYWNDGGQLVSPHDKNVINEVNAIESLDQVRFEPEADNIKHVGAELDEAYLSAIATLSIRPDAVRAQHDLNIVYSSIHGTGITMVPQALERWGFTQVNVVKSQAQPDGNFPTVVYPNPEEHEAMTIAMEEGRQRRADIVMATDPDADRVGLAIKNADGDYQLLNGNQIGSLLVYYVLSSYAELGKFREHDYAVKTIVTTQLIADIAARYGIPCHDVLTGFKYIGEMMTNNQGKGRYVVGGEESYGYLVGELVRDKDAVVSCTFIAEAAAYYKGQGKTLFDVLLELYLEYGYYKEKLISLTRKGKAGAEEIKAMMAGLRANPPKTLGGIAVARIKDYQEGVSFDPNTGERETIALPKSDVLQFITVQGDIISARPSGTEPKIKFYCSVKQPLDRANDFARVDAELDAKVERIMAEIV